MARVRIAGLTKRFDRTEAVRDFSVEVRDGEFITFLGPSGCGKTTSLRLIAGFIRPDRGSITIGDRVVTDPAQSVHVPPEDRGIGMVFQSYAVWPHMNVLNNVGYPLKIQKVPRRELVRRVEETLALVKMPELIDRYPHQLSGGQQQRVALARALVMSPQVLLLDEPLSNLDAKLREEMRLEIKDLQRETGVTIVFVTHDQLEAMVMSDRVVVMDGGQIRQIGTPEQIYHQPADRFVADFIGTANFLPVERRTDGVAPACCPGLVLPFHPPDGLGEETLVLMIRPEKIRLDRKHGQVQVTVRNRMFTGEAVTYIVELEGQALTVRTEAGDVYDPGQKVHMSVTGGYFLT